MLQFAATKNLDPFKISTNQFEFAQCLLVNRRAALECIERVEIDDRVMFMKGGVVKSAFRQTSNQWHLPAFKPEADAAAGTRFLSLVTFAARLAVTGAFPTA